VALGNIKEAERPGDWAILRMPLRGRGGGLAASSCAQTTNRRPLV